MNARARLHTMIRTNEGSRTVWAEDEASTALDAYRTEVLRKAVGRLRAIPVQCTALTGPVWYGTGWNAAIRELEEIADYGKPDDEEYPGELQRLRARMRELRAAALRNEDMARVQQILIDHATYEAKATSEGEVAP